MDNENRTVVVLRYKSEFKSLWDSFVSTSKNGVFLFYRDYMEYHSNRFKDNSLLFFKEGKIVGLLPANIEDCTLCSHAGLTFGGLISGYSMTTPLMMEIFEQLVQQCKEEGINKIVYKTVPYVYHSIPADEDLYALFRYNAKLTGRSSSSCIYIPEKREFSSRITRAIKKAEKHNLIVEKSTNLTDFMGIVSNILSEKYKTKPVHTLQEIAYLGKRFPDNIKLFASFSDDVMLAGILVYESKNVAHSQYSVGLKEGQDIGALDLIYNYLITNYYKDKKYFDFGISTEMLGQILNVGLICHKEAFGATAIMYDTYELSF